MIPLILVNFCFPISHFFLNSQRNFMKIACLLQRGCLPAMTSSVSPEKYSLVMIASIHSIELLYCREQTTTGLRARAVIGIQESKHLETFLLEVRQGVKNNSSYPFSAPALYGRVSEVRNNKTGLMNSKLKTF